MDSDGEISTLVKGSGLSSACVSAVSACADGSFFAVGYAGGSLDVISNGKLVSIADVWGKNYLKPSKITDLTCTNTLILAAGDFGVSFIDPARMQVYAVCAFPAPVDRVSILDQKVFAMSSGNVYYIDVTNVNLQDFDNWNIVKIDFNEVFASLNFLYDGPHPKSVPDDKINAFASMDGILLAASAHYTEITKRGLDYWPAPDGEEFMSAFFNPYNKAHVFLGGSNGELFEYISHTLKQRYQVFDHGAIIGMACTPEGDLLVLSDSRRDPLRIFDHNGQWHSPQWVSRINDSPVSILQVSRYEFWINLGQSGIMAIDLGGTPLDFADDKVTTLYPTSLQGERIGSAVTAMALDNDGYAYLGTDNGVAYLANPHDVFDGQPRFVLPIVTETGHDYGDYSQYLLRHRNVSDIVVDAANRKWISVLGAGVFLVSEYADSQIQHYTAQNSPLPSDTVYRMEYVDKTGEVFMSTNCGLVSYISDVQVSMPDLKSVTVYPNPVRPDYTCDIHISGLEDMSHVRITDVSGRLVYKTQSQGGHVLWDGKNLTGSRCATGVYLVFVTNVDTGHSIVKKLLFVR